MSSVSGGARLRLQEELGEIGLVLTDTDARERLLLDEIAAALRPVVHERRIATSGTIIEPAADPEQWSPLTGLDIERVAVGEHFDNARRFTDGLSSWLLRWSGGDDEWIMFDRPAGSERDLVVLASAFDATIVQRHPSGTVVVVDGTGVLRWNGLTWHREPHVSTWIDVVTACSNAADPDVLRALLEFAVHDLGAQGIGATLIYRPDGEPGPPVERRLPTPPPLRVGTPFHLGPLRHALTHVDGAAVFDRDGVLRELGVRLVPSPRAEEQVDPIGGTRHTSARRYSFDDPTATVVVVSEDGPVSVARGGAIIGSSPTGA